MDRVIEDVSKITKVKKGKIYNVINKNLDKIDDPDQLYKFVANQCKGIVNKNGLCWGISLIQFVSPISEEDIEIDNILSVLNKYCSRYGRGGKMEDYRNFLYNFTGDVRKVDNSLLGLYADLYTNILHLGPRKAKPPPLVFSERHVIVTGFHILKEIKRRNFNDYEIHSILINMHKYKDEGGGHAICLRICNKTLFLFDNSNAYKITEFTLSDVIKDAKVIMKANTKRFNGKFNKEKVDINIIAVLMKRSCLKIISSRYNIDENYVNKLI